MEKLPPPFEFLDGKSDEYIEWFIRSFEEKHGKGSWKKTLAEKREEDFSRHGVVRDSIEDAIKYATESKLPERFPNLASPSTSRSPSTTSCTNGPMTRDMEREPAKRDFGSAVAHSRDNGKQRHGLSSQNALESEMAKMTGEFSERSAEEPTESEGGD